jgi:hypothetical protein
MFVSKCVIHAFWENDAKQWNKTLILNSFISIQAFANQREGGGSGDVPVVVFMGNKQALFTWSSSLQ